MVGAVTGGGPAPDGDLNGTGRQDLRGASQQDIEILRSVFEGQVLHEHARELGAVESRLAAVREPVRLSTHELEHDGAGALGTSVGRRLEHAADELRHDRTCALE